ncbi:hypothetical protein K439DRAFT_1247673, partial [Ramaria rubella]
IHKQILKAWELHFQQLKKKLAAALGKISHTADIWSDQNLRSWLVITVHYILRDVHSGVLTMEADIIAFH